MLVILALALIVVGPDKLPGLARSVAKGIFELKKTVEQLKDSITEETGDIPSDLRKTADEIRKELRVDELPFQRPDKNTSPNLSSVKDIIDVDAGPARQKRPWEADAESSPESASDGSAKTDFSSAPEPDVSDSGTKPLKSAYDTAASSSEQNEKNEPAAQKEVKEASNESPA